MNGNYRVLFVDDETMIVNMGIRILERSGYLVVGMSDSEAALEEFRSDPTAFDLVVTDYTMPKMTGDQLAREILAIRPEIPVVLTTGLVQESAAIEGRLAGVREIILKPFRPSDFTRTIQTLMERSNGGRNGV